MDDLFCSVRVRYTPTTANSEWNGDSCGAINLSCALASIGPLRHSEWEGLRIINQYHEANEMVR
jgi:hypothetical protein